MFHLTSESLRYANKLRRCYLSVSAPDAGSIGIALSVLTYLPVDSASSTSSRMKLLLVVHHRSSSFPVQSIHATNDIQRATQSQSRRASMYHPTSINRSQRSERQQIRYIRMLEAHVTFLLIINIFFTPLPSDKAFTIPLHSFHTQRCINFWASRCLQPCSFMVLWHCQPKALPGRAHLVFSHVR